MNKIAVWLVFAVSAVLAAWLNWPTNKAYLIACDVGQGDAILLTKGTTQILIDGGPDKKVLACLQNNMPFWDKKIELMVNTHPDKDHLYGLWEVLKHYQVKQLVSNSLWTGTDLFERFLQSVQDQHIPVYSPQKGDQLVMGEFGFLVLWPEQTVGDSSIWGNKEYLAAKNSSEQPVLGLSQATNDLSIVLQMNYQDKKILLTGDITSQTEEKVAGLNELQPVDILKVAHHGSKYSSSEQFLQSVQPKIAVISVGKNPWGHPTKEVLKRLGQVDSQVLRTDEKGEIKIALDP